MDRYQEAEDVLSSYLKTFRNRHTLGQLIRVGFTGVGNTIVYFALLNLFLQPLGRFWAITVGTVVAISLSYVLNRRWSFRINDGSLGNARESVIFFAVNLIGWGLAIFITEFANEIWGPLSRLEVNLASVMATGLIVLPKFVLYRDVIFKKSLAESQQTGDREATLRV